jgi:hypothetical protein
MRIKVTGYIDTEELDETEILDLSHEMGITDAAFTEFTINGGQTLPYLEDLEFELVND